LPTAVRVVVWRSHFDEATDGQGRSISRFGPTPPPDNYFRFKLVACPSEGPSEDKLYSVQFTASNLRNRLVRIYLP